MSKPMFFYAGVYTDASDAAADLKAIKSLNDSKAIGSYDSEIIVKKPDGNVKVTKTEKPAEHGAWVGAAAGAGVAVLFPPALPLVVAGAAAGGAGVGAWFGHLAHGVSRGEAKRIGAMLKEGDSAVVVVGIDRDAEQVEKTATHARDHVLKRAVADWDDAEQDALEAVKQDEATPA
jgi:uncharacterized membrane protein